MPGQQSKLYPWYIGMAIIAAFELVAGYMFLGPACPCSVSPVPQLFLLLLIVLPLIYLTLMYLALRSQP
jgi:hypothetical protein